MNEIRYSMPMFDGTCPNCGSENIYMSKHHLRWDKMTGEAIYLKQAPFRMILIHHYVCIECRLIESYVMDNESVQNILDEWYPVNGKSKRNNTNDLSSKS